LEASRLRIQVCTEGTVRVGIGIDGAIIIIVLGHRYPLGSGELLFQVMGDGLLHLSSEGGDALTYPCLIQGLVCGSHSGNKSLLLSVRGSSGGLGRGLGRGRNVILLPISDGVRGSGSGVSLLTIDRDVRGAT
jgi:hypothetical protein